MSSADATWMDLLMDWAHDAGAHLCWGTRQVIDNGSPGTKHWINLQLPDKVIEHLAPSLNTAAWCVMAEVEPDPLDRPEEAS